MSHRSGRRWMRLRPATRLAPAPLATSAPVLGDACRSSRLLRSQPVEQLAYVSIRVLEVQSSQSPSRPVARREEDQPTEATRRSKTRYAITATTVTVARVRRGANGRS